MLAPSGCAGCNPLLVAVVPLRIPTSLGVDGSVRTGTLSSASRSTLWAVVAATCVRLAGRTSIAGVMYVCGSAAHAAIKVVNCDCALTPSDPLTSVRVAVGASRPRSRARQPDRRAARALTRVGVRYRLSTRAFHLS